MTNSSKKANLKNQKLNMILQNKLDVIIRHINMMLNLLS
jgi:hypothetical protein